MARNPTTGSRSREEWSAIWIPLLLVGATVLLGWHGFHAHHRLSGQPIAPLEALYLAAGLPIQETTTEVIGGVPIPPTLQAARLLSLLVVPYAFVLAFAVLFGRLVAPLRIRAWNWPLLRNRGGRHHVVCGLGAQGYELLGDLLARGERVAVVERDPENPYVGAVRERGAVVVVGDASLGPVLRDAGAAEAAMVFVTAGTDETNVRILKRLIAVTDASPRRDGPLCNVEIHDRRIREFVHRALPPEAGLEVASFNTFEATARALLQEWPLDRTARGPLRPIVHLVLIGYSALGRALLLEAMLQGQYPHPRRLRVTVLSDDPATDEAHFLAEYPCFRPGLFPDQPRYEEVRRDVLPAYRFERLAESDAELLHPDGPVVQAVSSTSLTTVLVCLDRGMRSMGYAAALVPGLQAAADAVDGDVQLCCYYEYPDEEPRLALGGPSEPPGGRVAVHTFDNFLDGCSVARVLARPLDEMARAVARLYGEAYGGPAWRSLSEADRVSNRRAADHVPVKLRAVGAALVPAAAGDPGFHLTPEEAELLAELEHRRWTAEKLLSGWRPLPRTEENLRLWSAGKELVKAQKLHVDLVPYQDLDAQHKDRLLVEGIPAIAAAAGCGVRRSVPSAAVAEVVR